MSKARQIRDMKDTVTILGALAAHNPFSLDINNDLRNIMNGVNADSNVNADTAKSVGEKIISSMNGMLATDYSFKPSAQAVTMASKSSKYKLTLNFYFSASLSHVIIPNSKNYFSTSSVHIPQLFAIPHSC